MFYRCLDIKRTAASTLNGMIIAIDRTKRQNEEHKALKKTLDARIAKGETNLKIRHGKIVNTDPPGSSFPNKGGEEEPN